MTHIVKYFYMEKQTKKQSKTKQNNKEKTNKQKHFK